MKIGDKIPDLRGKTGEGEDLRLRDQQGRFVVVYFYPKDSTPGCTVEACSFRDSHDAFREAGAEVIGISSDSGPSHRRFADRHDRRPGLGANL